MTSEALLRLGVFLFALIVFLAWEHFAPRRPLKFLRSRRWISNIGLSLLNQLSLRLVLPVLAVGLAVVVQQRGWGLFNVLDLPIWLSIFISFLLLDLAIYIQHIVFHRIDWLWRLHRVHHTDLDFDVTTAVRFHPVEIIFSMLIKMALVVVLGAAPLAVLIFEIILNLTALFNHSNIAMPGKLDRLLRWVVVTPDMHRVHHSVEPIETDSNFGFNLPWWDYLFNTYRAQPRKGHDDMVVGLLEFRSEEELALSGLLSLPFRTH